MSQSNRRLAVSILDFLRRELSSPNVSDSAKESLEVSLQCLMSAYEVDDIPTAAATLPHKLEDIFNATDSQFAPKADIPEASEADKAQAAKFKNEGNDFMKAEQFSEAVQAYSKAIALEQNAIYYCNRAAAHSRLNDHYAALNDCDAALSIDPNYSKAYSRKGLAHAALEQHREACECFYQALQMEPGNEMYKANLQQSEQKLRDATASHMGGMPGLGGLNLGGMDLGSILNNPVLMNMASSMMSNPQMQQMMSSFMSTAATGGNPSQPGGGPQNMAGLLQAGQQLASMMQQNNPELVAQLQQEFRQQQRPPNEDGDRPGTS